MRVKIDFSNAIKLDDEMSFKVRECKRQFTPELFSL